VRALPARGDIVADHRRVVAPRAVEQSALPGPRAVVESRGRRGAPEEGEVGVSVW